jgi:hypothetical protein
MYQKTKSNNDYCALDLYLNPTGKKSPKYEYKANADSLFTCSLTKKKYKLSQFNEWYMTEGVQNFAKRGHTPKWYAKTQMIETPKPYDKGHTQIKLSYIMIPPYKPSANVDGMKTIGHSMPPQATQFAPDNAQPISMSDLTDDEIPF